MMAKIECYEVGSIILKGGGVANISRRNFIKSSVINTLSFSQFGCSTSLCAKDFNDC